MGKSKGKMRSKTIIGVRKPPLSLIDSIIYLAGFSIAIGIGFGMLPVFLRLNESILFGDPKVLAATQGSVLGFAVFAAIGWLACSLGFLGRHFSAGQPIFGNPKITYGVFPWKKDLFPLFGSYPEKEKIKRDTYQIRKKRKEKLMTLILGIVICLLFLVYGGLQGACLRDDLSVTVFRASDDSLKHVYTREDFEELEFCIHYHSGTKGSGYWDLSMKIEMEDGRTRRFCCGDFKDPIVMLETMRELKAVVPSHIITIEGEHKLDHIIEKYAYDASQARMLWEVFDLEL